MQVNRQQFVAIGDMPANFGVALLRDTCLQPPAVA